MQAERSNLIPISASDFAFLIFLEMTSAESGVGRDTQHEPPC